MLAPSKIFLMLLFFIIAAPIYSQKVRNDSDILSVAVLNIQADSSNVSVEDLIGVSDYLSSELMGIPKLKVFSRKDVQKVLQHHSAAQALGCDSPKCVGEIAKALEVDFLLTGSIANLGSKYLMNLNLINAQTAESVSRQSIQVKDDIGLLVEHIPNLLVKLINQLEGVQVTEIIKAQSNLITKMSSFKDPRDQAVYKTSQLGDQVYMSENLNYAQPESVCYDEKPENCEKYGRLYTWKAAMKACPEGWHLPSDDEWEQLAQKMAEIKMIKQKYGDDWMNLGKFLRAPRGWKIPFTEKAHNKNEFDFGAVGSGRRLPNGHFNSLDENGYWWSATEAGKNKAWYRNVHYKFDFFYRMSNKKTSWRSVRCFKDS